MNLQDYKLYNNGLIYKGAHHKEQKLSLSDKKKLLYSQSGWFVRNVYNFDIEKETSFWFVIKDYFGGMDELKSSTRNQIRRAIKTLDIRPIHKDEMLEFGYEVYLLSYNRYRNISTPPAPRKTWEGWINNGNNVEYWGAFEKTSSKLIAYSENLLQENTCKYVALKAIPEYLNEYYPFYGLIYLMNEYYLSVRKLKYVSDGARTVSSHSNIQSFLEKFQFRKAYCCLDITYVWWLHYIVKILFPFRKIVPVKKIKYLLDFEAMQRGMI